MTLESSRARILELVRAYADEKSLPGADFVSGKTPVPPSGKVLGAQELVYAVDAILDGWLTTGRFNAAFEAKLGQFLGVDFVLTCNSGSSANLLALSALTSPLLRERALKPGDEVITAAAGFPTTVNPILQNGLIPVFVDSAPPTYNPTAEAIEAAITPQTRAIMLAHTLGNPFAAAEIRALADKRRLWLVEDCCDALGSTYRGQKTGAFGHIATLSFYPAHHITMGEGGAVFTNDPVLKRIVESFRDWGRDCWCAPGRDNTCGKRFQWRWDELPEGYDHKYVYSHPGYNLKITDMQAAVGLAQLERLEGFITARKRNFATLNAALADAKAFFVFPEATPESDPAWFGYPLTLRNPQAAARRVDLLRYLDERKIGVRLLFAGNLTRQPYMQGREYRVSGTLSGADGIMNDTFWIGLYPGLSEEMLAYSARCLREFFGLGF
ncbi:MAG: lipopolysaccharide biosynthesis protein RfbH [Zoogloeaceae bacterium]|jgi:CDP-6-deoxy-D-xylo-4-hexulose-3-dehydrase|nr:lipopolysaccharide biosynthesis protein RfbH [Zoogloeaceae bacterium]